MKVSGHQARKKKNNTLHRIYPPVNVLVSSGTKVAPPVEKSSQGSWWIQSNPEMSGVHSSVSGFCQWGT
ncbi:hypothetical protein Y1Q_0003105 [Alligator mississippiensis]|uniref:Uncharacterized protein n=1 Tax=Alligator mississippiensis TaxID=8496 RepID=A0A151MDG8_ALLMI|nr:hypothetical protein Y1Q_0003105 [Alligator mississippiensis]